MATIQERMHSTIDKYEAKDFSYFLKDGVEGLSEKMLKEHYGLYEKYIAKTNEILDKLKTVDESQANHNYSEHRELLVELTHNLNAVILHELYFSNLIDHDTLPTPALKEMIQRDFGSWENYIYDLETAGKSARGWAITAYNYRDGKLHNFIIDGHNIFVPVFVRPILIMDVWEHSYTLDYGTNKPEYISAFLKNINWPVVSVRLESALKADIEHKKSDIS